MKKNIPSDLKWANLPILIYIFAFSGILVCLAWIYDGENSVTFDANTLSDWFILTLFGFSWFALAHHVYKRRNWFKQNK